jgi:hypothetical protein
MRKSLKRTLVVGAGAGTLVASLALAGGDPTIPAAHADHYECPAPGNQWGIPTWFCDTVQDPQMPATVPAGVTEASICADLDAWPAAHPADPKQSPTGSSKIHATWAELDKLKGMGMSYNDAFDAVGAAVWYTCPRNADGPNSSAPPKQCPRYAAGWSMGDGLVCDPDGYQRHH